MRSYQEAKFNHTSKNRVGVAFEMRITKDEYRKVRDSSMRGKFPWEFYYLEETRKIHITLTKDKRTPNHADADINKLQTTLLDLFPEMNLDSLIQVRGPKEEV